jgi:hypothetical protein
MREPQPGIGDEAAHVAAYLDYYRETVIGKCASLPGFELRETRLPSRWTPIQLLNHLAFMERRWFVWGFLGEHVDEPWGDGRGDRWVDPSERTFDDLVTALRAIGSRTTSILASTPLETVASSAGRFADSEPPDLRWICFHVLQEYARHAGHLDIAVELADGHLGE